jgi:hypothetical protein
MNFRNTPEARKYKKLLAEVDATKSLDDREGELSLQFEEKELALATYADVNEAKIWSV